ncbi:MAG: radical SAM protein, partial [Candidatus Omnitrophica bacterium]|nr:radical SAM protein [Candidatus Omnitrophota bacterium]
GCKNVCFGVESGDPEVWRAINKNVTESEIVRAHKAAKAAGLIVTSFFMVGNVGETKDSIKKTIDFIGKIETDYPTCSIATPFPGTKMYEMGREKGWIKTKDWSEYLTTPHVKMNYHTVWTNGILSEREILDAYYYVNSKIVFKKFRTRYGRLYFLNPFFYKREIFKRIREKGLKNFALLLGRVMGPGKVRSGG